MKKPYDYILNNLALGSFESRLDPIFGAIITIITPAELRYINQTFPITCPAEEVLHIPISDNVDGLDKYFDECYAFIEEHIKTKKVLVHCRAGISRSPTIVINYISRCNNVHPLDALKFVRNKRPIVDPYRGFIHELVKDYSKRNNIKHSGIPECLLNEAILL